MIKQSNLLKFGLVFLLLTSLSTIHANTKQNVSWQSKDYIKKAFFEIAYKNEYQQKLSKLRRWNKEIRYKVDYFKFPVAFEMVENMIDEHFKDLSDITTVPIIKGNQSANFKIILTRRAHYEEAIKKYTRSKVKKLATESNCILSLSHRNYSLNKATVIIPVDHVMKYGLLPACVVEELTQAMGLPNDSDWVKPSIANDKSILDLLTGLDYLMLKILYDKRLAIGMSIDQSSLIVDEILLDFEKQGLIKNSINKARELRMNKQLEG